jgi:HTH-type transcriptional regulator, transcriptional repressor of NAD biosynthesis genes
VSRGFLLGKFMPPHRGHQMLCDFARAYCDELTVLVCTRACEPIDGALRAQWMRELVPNARVVHFDKDVPQEPSEHPDFWRIWREIAAAAHPEPIDFVFTSESYGGRLAEELGARHVPFDPDRLAAPISGSKVRANPYQHWDFLPAPVRAHYVKTVCLFGPESTGKSTLATRLAARLDTVAAPEYGRTYCQVFGTHCTADDLRNIVKGQAALEFAAKREANRLLILDTDRLMTALWADMLIGVRPPDLDAVTATADLYLLADIDIPWADDGTRYFPGDSARQRFYRICREELEKRGLRYETIAGDRDGRLKGAMDAINRHFPELGGV